MLQQSPEQLEVRRLPMSGGLKVGVLPAVNSVLEGGRRYRLRGRQGGEGGVTEICRPARG